MVDGYQKPESERLTDTMTHIGVAIVALNNAINECPDERIEIRLHGTHSVLERIHEGLDQKLEEEADHD